MATTWGETEVRCPFYLESSGRTIRCEGVFPESWTTMTFSGTGARRQQMQKSCMADYCKCRLYRQIEEKYES